MNAEERLEKFFKDWLWRSDRGEISSLSPSEIAILKVYRDWEIDNEDIQELFGGTKRD